MAADHIVGILLAAGSARRFGSDKLLHPLADGRPMAATAAGRLRQVCSRCIAVVRPGQDRLANLLALEGYAVHVAPDAEQGIGHSLSAAVKAAPNAAGWLVALADMPIIAPATYTAVAEALRNGASLAAPVFGGRRGHPVGFARDWFEALAGLEGDRGARDVLAAHAAALALVPCDDPGILVDVDVPSHLEDLPTRLLRTPTPPAGAPAFLNPLLGAKS